MNPRLKTLALVAVLVAITVFVPLSTVQAQGSTFPISGTGLLGTIPINFQGTFDIQRFTVQNTQILAAGRVSGTVTDAGGAVLQTVRNVSTSIPVLDLITGASCQILLLELGPLHLNLLGLVVDLNQIVLDVTAVPGAGNLLGNLLCAIVGLFDQGVPLNIIADLLNAVIDLLDFFG